MISNVIFEAARLPSIFEILQLNISNNNSGDPALPILDELLIDFPQLMSHRALSGQVTPRNPG